jgi:guanylate kinase
MHSQLYVISGPSGVGKSTIINKIMKTVKGLGYSVSHTSRLPRGKEADGVHYHFVDRKVFRRMIDDEAFVEWAQVYHDFYGTSYGSLKDRMDQGLDVVMDLDIQGAENVKKHFKEAILIYVLPPSLEDLEKRLRGRATDDKVVIGERLEQAHIELKACVNYDYIVFNEDLEIVVREVESIITSVRCLKSNQLALAEKIFHTTLSPGSQ